MFRKNVLIVSSIVVALNIVVLAFRLQSNAIYTTLLLEARAQQTQELSASLRSYPRGAFHSGYHFIGGLVTSSYWTSVIPIGDDQAAALKKLDLVIWDARVASKHEDADYLETNPVDYREYLDPSSTLRMPNWVKN